MIKKIIIILTLTAFVLFAIDSEALDFFVAFLSMATIKSANECQNKR